MKAEEGHGGFPIVIGVTGHRDVDSNHPGLRETVRRELRRLGDAFPSSPFVVLSPLAEGADRLVAREAQSELSAELVVPLPLPREEYAKDFVGEGSIAEFDTLVSGASTTFLVPPSGDEAASFEGKGRVERYARTGAWVATHCHVLFALWRGGPARGPGGTADVVAWKRGRRVPPEYRPAEDPGIRLAGELSGSVVQIHPESTQVQLLGPEEGRWSEASFAGVDTLNRAVDRHRRRHGDGGFSRSRADLIGPAGDRIAAHRPFDRVVSAYARCDRLALRCQRSYRRFLLAGLVLIFLAPLTLTTIDLGVSFVPVAGFGYAAVVGLLGGLLLVLRRIRLRDRYLHLRCLAEGLRVLAFWRLAGIEERVSPHYQLKHSKMLAWIREAIRGIEAVTPPAGTRGRVSERDVREAVRKLWIEKQADYLARKADRSRGTIRRRSRLVGAALGLSVLLAVGVAAYTLWSGEGGHRERAAALVEVAMGAVAAVALVISTSQHLGGYEEEARRYGVVEAAFRGAARELAGSEPNFEEALVTAGREALLENGDWCWLHHSLGLELPAG